MKKGTCENCLRTEVWVKEMKEHDGVFGQAPVVEEEGEQ